MFSLPFHPYQQPPRPKRHHGSSKKRKRKSTRYLKHARSYHRQDEHNPAGSVDTPATLTPNEIYQCAIAGQPMEEPFLAQPFPHVDSTNIDGPPRFDYALRQTLKPAHDSVSGKKTPCALPSLHQQHLAVITAILHRSLQENDFIRAGRALGLLLRNETDGKPVDIRAEGRWTIGAELLIRREAQLHSTSWENSPSTSGYQGESAESPPTWFTRKGFEAAKQYYERLIVQYPFHKHHPRSVSALDFYPAMFALWISVVQEETRLRSSEPRSTENEFRDDEPQDELPSRGGERLYTGHKPAIEEMQQAEEIADRMDSVMQAVPYREDIKLKELRRMVQLWICDLHKRSAMEGGK